MTDPGRATPETSHPRRHGRSTPAGGRRIRTTERDLFLLEVLGELRFASTTQMARLCFEGSTWAAQKRLRKLLDAGLVRVWVRSLSEETSTA